MNTAVITKGFDDYREIPAWANGLIGNYVPDGCGLEGVIVNSIVSIQVVSEPTYFLVVLLVEVWCPGTEENDPA